MPRAWEKGASGGFDRVAGTGRVSVSLSSGPGPRDASPRRKEPRRVGGLLSTPLPARLGPAGSYRQASPNPTHRRSTKCPGARPGNPKLFPPDGLGIGAGGGISSIGAGGGIELPV
jgi:hypothetical protein